MEGVVDTSGMAFFREGEVGHDGLSDESKRGPAGPLKKEDFYML